MHDLMPSVQSPRTAVHRRVLISHSGAVCLPGGRVIDGAKARDPLNTGDVDVLRPGLLLGRISASGKFAPAILGLTTAAYDKDALDGSQLYLQVSAPTAVEVVRRIGSTGSLKLIAPPTAAGTVAVLDLTFTAVNLATNRITFAEALSADAVNGAILAPADGSHLPRLVIADGYGVKVTDRDGGNADVPLVAGLVAGCLDTSRLVNYPADSALRAWIRSQLRQAAPALVFDDDF